MARGIERLAQRFIEIAKLQIEWQVMLATIDMTVAKIRFCIFIASFSAAASGSDR